MKGVLGLGVPLLVVVIWATFGSPKAPYLLQGWTHVFLEFAIYGGSAAALLAAGHPMLGIILLVSAIINRIVLSLYGY